MKINTKIRYGLRTMIEIASSDSQDGVLQKDIAKNQDISLKYLDPIVASLKLKQLIVNYKGRGSGYVLARPAEEITIFDIYTAFEQVEIVNCIDNPGFCIRTKFDCQANLYWLDFRYEVVKILKNKTLKDILEVRRCECANKK